MTNLLGYYQNFHQGFLAAGAVVFTAALLVTAPVALVTLSLRLPFSS